MRTSTAEKNGYICPKCGDQLTRDLRPRGFVRHKTNPDCRFENGQKDDCGAVKASSYQSYAPR